MEIVVGVLLNKKNIFLGVLLLLSSNSAISQNNQIGNLIFSDSSEGVFRYDFSTKRLENIYRTNNSFIGRIDRWGSENIIFSECLISGKCEIKLINQNSGKVNVLGNGNCPVVFKELLFFCDRGNALKYAKVIADKINFNDVITIAKDVNHERIVSSEQGLFIVDSSWALSYYNFTNGEIISSNDKLVPLFYWEQKNALVAYSLHKKKYFLVRVDDKSLVIKDVDLYISGAPITVFDGRGVIFSKAVRTGLLGESHHIFYQNLLGEERLLLKNKIINSGFFERGE